MATIEGEQTEALVGPRGSVLEAIHEITKTGLTARSTTPPGQDCISPVTPSAKAGLDIDAAQLIDQIATRGRDMLEPMSAADRKVIHDSVAAREGSVVLGGRTSTRYVVIATTEESADSETRLDPQVSRESGVRERWHLPVSRSTLIRRAA